MKFQINKFPKELFDPKNNPYTLKDFIKSGRRVDINGKHVGWEFWIGNFYVRLQK